MATDVSVMPFPMTHFTEKLEFSSLENEKLAAIGSTPLKFKKLPYRLATIAGSSRFSTEKQDFT